MRKRPLLHFQKSKNNRLISSKSALSADGYHEVGSFRDFEPFTPNFTPFRFNVEIYIVVGYASKLRFVYPFFLL